VKSEGVKVVRKRVNRATLKDLLKVDGIILGSLSWTHIELLLLLHLQTCWKFLLTFRQCDLWDRLIYDGHN
jgi:hypothetical protein